MLALVTGAAGFIGSHLSRRLIAEGHEVIGVDCFLDNYPRNIKESNLEGLVDTAGFRLVEGDLCALDLGALLEGVGAVFHQAAVAGVRASWGRHFHDYLLNNIYATQLLLEACKGVELERFVYASSSSVYGDTPEMPLREDAPTRPFSPYGVSKLAGENLAVLYHRNYGIPTVSLRYFTIYGPGQRPDMGFHKFIMAVIKGDEINVFGDGSQTRDFTYVASAVEANLLALESGTPGEVYNIGGGSSVRLDEAIRLIEEAAGREARIVFTDTEKGDVTHTMADIEKARRGLGYAPVCALEEGIGKHYEWLASHAGLYS